MPITSELLKRYKHKVFIETGAYHGDGIQAALDAGFEKAFSVEIDPKNATIVSRRFKDAPVAVILGDSANCLRLLADAEDATIFLDAHQSEVVLEHGNPAPLLEELRVLAKTRHTIIIDDMRLFGLWGASMEMLQDLFSGRKFVVEGDLLICE